MGRLYSLEFGASTVAANVDFWEIQPADDKPIKIHSIYLSQSTETGDAQEEMMQVQIIRGQTTSGSGGIVPTARPLNRSDAAFAGTIECLNLTTATAGSFHKMHTEAFNVRTGWFYCPIPENRIQVSQADATVVVRLLTVPTDPINFLGTIYFEEE